MALLADDRHRYRAPNGCPSACRVRVYAAGDRTVVVATDLDEGCSVTNAAEALASALERRHCPDPGRAFVFVEHYRRPATRTAPASDSFALVAFDRRDDGRLVNPYWRHLDADQVADLLGVGVGERGGV